MTKSEAKKSFRQRRLDDDGNQKATASRLVRFKYLLVKKTALHYVSKYNQLGGSTHLPMHMCFGHDDTVSAPKVQPSEYLRWIVSLLNWHRRVLLGLEIFGAFSLNVAYGYCKKHLEMLSRYHGMLLPQDCGQMSDVIVRRWVFSRQ